MQRSRHFILSGTFLVSALVGCDEPKPAPSGTPSSSSAASTGPATPNASASTTGTATGTPGTAEAPPAPGAEPAEWIVDTAHTRVGFSAKHLLITKVRGQFKTFSGKAFIDEKTPANSKLSVEIDVKSVDTNEPKRDAHLRTSDFFDADKHPKMTFASTKVERDPKNAKALLVTGDLTLRGVTKPVVLTVDSLTPEIESPFGPTWRLRGAHATGRINRKDFGVAWDNKALNGTAVVSDDVELELEVELKRETKAVPTAASGSASASATPAPSVKAPH